ncbi:MAG: hypothetical protein IKT95_07585, partial [Spirochaetales bacterium]|nr:hypothetical protein [Spirochaetales bacterium]
MKRTLVVLLLAAVMMLFAVSCKEEAHEHTWDEGKVTTPATCTDPGVKTYTCECGETKTEAIPALGHNWNEGVVTTPATCSTAGVKTYTCQNDNTHTKTEAVPATGEHSWGEWVITTPATCDAAGVKTATCSSGGETKTENIPAIGHVWGEPTYSDGKTTWTCTNDGTHTKVVEGKVLMTVGETVTGYATLDAAIAAIEEGQTAVIVINED